MNLDAAQLAGRRAIAAGPLAPLAQSLIVELAPILGDEVWLPKEKAQLTPTGGRCPVHGALLEFDPHSPDRHRCLLCQTEYREPDHYRWWIMNYHLWLAERAAFASTVGLLTGDERCLGFAANVLERYVDAYLRYPNSDNVLGPTRPFFSTYLESVWLLHLVATARHVELAHNVRLDALRERVVAPSVTLIAEFFEGLSNRQVWNSAAIAAGRMFLGDDERAGSHLDSERGLRGLLRNGLLGDGTWYEGENYHLFAHRGLWYGFQCAAQLAVPLGAELEEHYRRGFLAPYLSALPDFTFPARRDSQYAVPLRQWRMAESCELGLAAGADERLASVLAEQYRADVPEGKTGREISTGEAERHAPAVRLTRGSLGWKSLLYALPTVPTAAPLSLGSVHQQEQGFAIFRRDEGKRFIAVDYGRAGGGHGHPDRLNLWFVSGSRRVLEDVGTGSYVDPSLAWYRSSLAHNAPMPLGGAQWPGDGVALAWSDDGEWGSVATEFDVAPGCVVRRRVVVAPEYFLDEVTWVGDDADGGIDLPIHVDCDDLPPSDAEAEFAGDAERFVVAANRLSRAVIESASGHRVRGGDDGQAVRVWWHASQGAEWWRLRVPGPPLYGAHQVHANASPREREILLARCRSARGTLTSLWDWKGAVRSVAFGASAIRVELTDHSDVHSVSTTEWSIARDEGGAPHHRFESAPAVEFVAPEERQHEHREPTMLPAVLELGERQYRRSEELWENAGAPTATVKVFAEDEVLVLHAEVSKREPHFAPDNAAPLDNEHPDTNSDGLQLYLADPGSSELAQWLVVPRLHGDVRITPRSTRAESVPLQATWVPTALGYAVTCRVPLRDFNALGSGVIFLNVVVNEMPATRNRRRGQLVASGVRGRDEWVYLRGDREDPQNLMAFIWNA